MKVDIVEVVIILVIGLLGLIDGLKNRNKWQKYRQSVQYFRIGIVLLLIGTIFNSLVEGRWDLNYIAALLSLKQAGRWWLFRLFTGIGYVSLIMGLEVLVLTKINRNQKQKK